MQDQSTQFRFSAAGTRKTHTDPWSTNTAGRRCAEKCSSRTSQSECSLYSAANPAPPPARSSKGYLPPAPSLCPVAVQTPECDGSPDIRIPYCPVQKPAQLCAL